MKKVTFALIAFAVTAACTGTRAASPNYTVNAIVPQDANGMKAYIVNYDTGEPVDSAIVENSRISISGYVDTPVMARLLVGSKRTGVFVLEPGDISIPPQGLASGTVGNTAMQQFNASMSDLYAQMQQADTDSARQVVVGRVGRLADEVIRNHGTDPVGYYVFLTQAYETGSQAELDSLLAIYPGFEKFERVQAVANGHKRAAATAPGQMYTDFTVGDQKLSDYVGKGHYTLVDFWASWCGPCRREMPGLKALHEKYHDQGLDILGVAVWDKPEDTRRAMNQLKLPWPQIEDAQTIPTDLYGITGIPHIILFDPDGRIVFRGLQGEALHNAVATTLADRPVSSFVTECDLPK